MASSEQVKTYLAYWFQLGKRLILNSGEALLPDPVVANSQYSAAFEACWQRAMAVEGKDCYLEGTEQTIAELLLGQWDLVDCARCGMPVPIINAGIQNSPCPCFDLPTWPNLELPMPRAPVATSSELERIRMRLSQRQRP